MINFEEKEKELVGRLDEQLRHAASENYVIDPDFIEVIREDVHEVLKELGDREEFSKEIARLGQMVSVIGYVVRRVYEEFVDEFED